MGPMQTDQASPLKSMSKTIKDNEENQTVTQRCIFSIKGKTTDGKVGPALNVKLKIVTRETEKVCSIHIFKYY